MRSATNPALLGFVAAGLLVVGCTPSSPASPDQAERFDAGVAALHAEWEADLRLDTNNDVWPLRLQEMCETDLNPGAFGVLGERFVAEDLAAGRDLGKTESSEFFRESNYVQPALWRFALDVCVAVPLTEAQEWVMPAWPNTTGMLESPRWPVRFAEMCVLDPNDVESYQPLADRYLAEDLAEMWPPGFEYPGTSIGDVAETLRLMAVHPEPYDVCPEQAAANTG